MEHPEITVQIMAGGRSSRMGQDKALVRLGGQTLLERAVETWSDWGGGLFLSVGHPERAALAPKGAVPVADRYPDCGPLGGLHAGLAVCPTPLLLLCAVDTPLLGPEQAEGLAAAIGTADACVYTVEGRPQPLFGLYRTTTCLPVAERLLAAGERRMRTLLVQVNTAELPAPDETRFRNLNTPEELRKMEEEFYKVIKKND